MYTAPCGYSQPSQALLYSQTEDKEFDDLEERFQWVSLCVTELKNNVAAYLDNLEVRILQLIMGRAGLVSLGSGYSGPIGPSDRGTSCRNQMEEAIQWLVAG